MLTTPLIRIAPQDPLKPPLTNPPEEVPQKGVTVMKLYQRYRHPTQPNGRWKSDIASEERVYVYLLRYLAETPVKFISAEMTVLTLHLAMRSPNAATSATRGETGLGIGQVARGSRNLA